ncbi:MAG: Y-family DNA polymerase [Sphingobacteriaceae bacterium]|nr:Y-family DNA polymerase [Sphingobacteriaceae bacterium]
MFALVDINNCYVSCQRLFRPELEGKIIVVLSNNDGCVISRSEEAKAIGVKMAAPEFMTRELLKDKEAYVFSSNYPLYADMSARLMNQLAVYTPVLEVYSIDEAFLQMSHLKVSELQGEAEKIVREIKEKTGIPITVGIAKTKTLAKLANRMAKKKTGNHHLVLDNDEKINEVIYDFPIEDVWGIGRQYGKKLYDAGVRNAGQLREKPEIWVQQNLTIQGLRLWKELWGQPCFAVKEFMERRKGVSCTRSFKTYFSDKTSLSEAIALYAATVAYKLRKDKSAALNLTIFLRTNKHRQDHDQNYPSVTLRLPSPSNNTIDITKTALLGLDTIYTKRNYVKAGVIATGLIPENEIQSNLFEPSDAFKKNTVSSVIDFVNARYGRGMIRMAAEGYEKKWSMKQEFLSPCYTTRWSDILKSR